MKCNDLVNDIRLPVNRLYTYVHISLFKLFCLFNHYRTGQRKQETLKYGSLTKGEASMRIVYSERYRHVGSNWSRCLYLHMAKCPRS